MPGSSYGRSAGWIPLRFSVRVCRDVGKRSGIHKNKGPEVTEPPFFGLIQTQMLPLRSQKSDLRGEQALRNRIPLHITN